MEAVYKHYEMKFVSRKLQSHQFEQEKDITTWKVFGEIKLELDDEIICEDIDLDQEIVIVDGERLTEAKAEQISEEIMEAVYKYKGIKFVPRKLNG